MEGNMTERKYGKSTIAEIDALSGSGEPLMWWHEAVETMRAMAAHIRELEANVAAYRADESYVTACATIRASAGGAVPNWPHPDGLGGGLIGGQ
jgi:hypothetical protein